MAVVATLLARESKGLLIGESATPDERAAIREAASSDPDVEDVRRIITQYLGPQTVLVLMDVVFRPELDGAALGDAVDRMEARIREARPSVKHIYIEVESLKDRAAGRGSATTESTPP
jgi:divalent metal cation (Fe/Co/Zn/Cd) transporter